MKNMENYFNWDPECPKGKFSSVHYSDYRLNKAKEQSTKEIVNFDTVAKLVNEFLNANGMGTVSEPCVQLTKDGIDYQKIQIENGLEDKRDIVWIKFTKDNFLGVVAASNDVNFDIPLSADDYNKKVKGKWQHNTSGILIHQLGKEWNEDIVFIFPLMNIPEGMKRGDIERGIGNYLISKNVPILDFYSHNY